MDEGARRLYVSHGTQVEVLDIDSGAIVGQISGAVYSFGSVFGRLFSSSALTDR